ncbi:polysaccharide deacetylase family protein [Vibrio caribbeanicus]|uniref:polysaccharide deacetylase family protein n=1 Tax=Vibrio caribbeanicus TaxID=701175 RepID=UPI00228488E2|nr:polysaccharide deacetylase family protein [Vibrio caribbeanicus]MCY9844263.1 polysaccharide deacetylase family protein [Vibrio caribbeanicus]
MNILMALSQLEVTGAEVYATTVGNQLTERGHSVYYVSDTLTKPHIGQFFKLRFNKRSIPRRFWHVAYLIYLIKKHKIQLVHAHSRASSWSCHIACKITRTPMVTSVHGRQPVHPSRKKFHAMGDKALPVCEAIEEQLVNDLGVSKSLLEVSRNGIATEEFHWLGAPQNNKPIISIIGRLTGPKGDLCYKLLDECLDTNKYHVRIVSGSDIEPRFDKFTHQVEFSGYSDNITSILATSDLVIGAGRVAMESLLCGRPTLAVGESQSIGLVDQNNIQDAIKSNFGDIGAKDLNIDFTLIPQQIELGLKNKHCDSEVTKTVKENYDLSIVVDQIEDIYQSVYVQKLRKEMPIIMYHRFIKNDSEKGIHGTYLHIDMLDKHLKLIKRMGFETITFEDLAERRPISRLEHGKRYIIITVDDGYKDNYELLFPLLKKYNFKAVVYAVSGETFNRWDVEVPSNPEKRVELMSSEQIRELSESGLVEIGGHTVTHPHLNQLTSAEQEQEIYDNKVALESMIGKRLTSFAYPYGSLNEDSQNIASKIGYQYAVATDSGPIHIHSDEFQIRRIAIFPRTSVFGLWRKIRGNYLFKKVK